MPGSRTAPSLALPHGTWAPTQSAFDATATP